MNISQVDIASNEILAHLSLTHVAVGFGHISADSQCSFQFRIQ